MAAGERLAQRCGLNHSFIGKALCSWCHDGQSGWRFVAARHAGSFGGKCRRRRLTTGSVRTVSLCRLLLVQSLLDEMALLVPNAHAALELLLHQRIFRNKTWRKASDANLLDTETISRGQRTSSAGLVGARVRSLG